MVRYRQEAGQTCTAEEAMHTTIRRVTATAFTLAALGAAPATMIATASPATAAGGVESLHQQAGGVESLGTTGTSNGGVESLGGTGSPDVFLHT
jgi:hypothetical protein